MRENEYLPLGSMVLWEGGVKKPAIISRGISVNVGDSIKIFDYAGAQYPEGIKASQWGYFNDYRMSKVISGGYLCHDDKIIVENINKYITELAKAGESGGV